MKKLVLAGSLGLSLLLPTATFGLAVDSLPANQKEAIKKEKEKEVEPPLENPKYPFVSGILIEGDPLTGKPYAFGINSKDGSIIDITYQKNTKPEKRIPTSDIVTWSSAFAGQSTDATNAVSIAVAGALFFWPMLLAAPFAVKTVKTQAYTVAYIDEYGRDLTIRFVSNDPPRPLSSLLKFSTGLEPGKQMPDDIAEKKYSERMPKLMAKLEEERKPLVKENAKKPWCSTADFTTKTPQLEKYQATLGDLNQVRSKLKLQKYEDSNKLSSEEKWKAYLTNNPGIAAWSKAYPKQADTLKSCS